MAVLAKTQLAEGMAGRADIAALVVGLRILAALVALAALPVRRAALLAAQAVPAAAVPAVAAQAPLPLAAVLVEPVAVHLEALALQVMPPEVAGPVKLTLTAIVLPQPFLVRLLGQRRLRDAARLTTG